MPDFMCEHGNCNSTDTPILLNDKQGGYRVRFCCWEHAGLYALRHAWMTEARARPEAKRRIIDAVHNLEN